MVEPNSTFTDVWAQLTCASNWNSKYTVTEGFRIDYYFHSRYIYHIGYPVLEQDTPFWARCALLNQCSCRILSTASLQSSKPYLIPSRNPYGYRYFTLIPMLWLQHMMQVRLCQIMVLNRNFICIEHDAGNGSARQPSRGTSQILGFGTHLHSQQVIVSHSCQLSAVVGCHLLKLIGIA